MHSTGLLVPYKMYHLPQRQFREPIALKSCDELNISIQEKKNKMSCAVNKCCSVWAINLDESIFVQDKNGGEIFTIKV